MSQAEACGRVLVLPDLVEVQGKRFDEATIIIASHVGGMEDIPVSHTHFYSHHPCNVLNPCISRALSVDASAVEGQLEGQLHMNESARLA